MAKSFQQTANPAPCGAIAACSGASVSTDASADCVEGGTAGTELDSFGASSATSGNACVFFEIDPDDGDSWDAGDYVARINVDSANSSITWTETHVCRVNSSCVSQETIGSLTGQSISLGTTGVKSMTVAGAAVTPAAGDRIYIVCVFDMGGLHGNQTAALIPDQLIDTPLSAGAVTTNVDPDGIASAEAVGAVSLDPTLDPAGVASAEAFGSAAAVAAIDTIGVASAEAFGAAAIEATLAAVGLASAESIGSVTIDVTLGAAGIPSAESFGSTNVERSTFVDSTGVASAEAFGAASADPTLDLNGVGSAEAFGASTVDSGVVVAATGVASAEAFGSAVIETEIAATGVASTETFGSVATDPALVAIGVASAEAFGSVAVDTTVTAIGIATAEAFGSATIDVAVTVAAIPPSEAFGSASVDTGTVVAPDGIASIEAFGALILSPTLDAPGLSSAEVFGDHALDPVVDSTGVASAESLGNSVVESVSVIGPIGIASAEAIGVLVLDLILIPSGIGSVETFGDVTMLGAIYDGPEAVFVTTTRHEFKVSVTLRMLSVATENPLSYWKRDEVGSKLQMQILSFDGAPIDLTDATVSLSVLKPSGVVVVWSTTIVDATDGRIEYKFAVGDLDQVGTYRAIAEIDRPGDDIDYAPSRGVAKLFVQDRLSA